MSNATGTWEYVPLLNECIKVIITICIGALMGHFEILETKSFLPQATRFVFNVALPLHILNGLGIGVDFYDDTFLWKFICLFLILRVIALFFSFGVATRKGGLGDVAVMWLALTWISTIILGIPIAAAVFGDPSKGRTYGILAAISSFIFQLPLQLVLFECHVLEKEYIAAHEGSSPVEADPAPVNDTNDDVEQAPTGSGQKVQENDTNALEEKVTLAHWMRWICQFWVWKKIFFQLTRNAVLWGILAGFVLSLTTVGPRFLNPTSEDYVAGLGWIFMTAAWLGECVSPVALVAMGVWMNSQGKQLFRIPIMSAFLYMLSKLVLVPLAALGLAKGLGLDDEAGRAAVLIAALPISMASFSLADRYEIGEAVLSENIALGTILILPTILLWNLVLDALDLFPIS
jgi:predicted permease